MRAHAGQRLEPLCAPLGAEAREGELPVRGRAGRRVHVGVDGALVVDDGAVDQVVDAIDVVVEEGEELLGVLVDSACGALEGDPALAHEARAH